MLRKVLGMFFWARIISTIGPSFLIFGHLNVSRVLGGLEASYVWCQEGIWGPMMLMMLAPCAITPTKRSKYTLWAVLAAANTSEMQLWARTWSACTKNHV